MTAHRKDWEIIEALKAAGGAQTQAATILGCTRVAIWKRIKKNPELAAYANPRGYCTKNARLEMSRKRRGENHWNWNGGSSFEPYCVKFNNEFKERVRDFFGRKCVECGAPENPKSRLCVHHVNFRKDACCAEDVIPLFVALCHSCHNKTNYNRGHWEARYTALIHDEYGGQCYLPKADPGRGSPTHAGTTLAERGIT